MRRFLSILALLCSTSGCIHAQTVLSGGATGVGKGSSVPPIVVCGITTQSLPGGVVGIPYSTQIQTAACQSPLTFSIISGSLPSWVTTTWPNATGTIAGTPDVSGTSSFIVKVVDALGNAAIFNQPLVITSSGSPGAPLAPDAALSSWDTSMAGTPTLNQTLCVGTPVNAALLPGGSCLSTFAGTTAGLATALNAVACGQVINVANIAGLGPQSLPSNKKCSNTQWIWLAFHDLSDPVFPPEGTHPDPCYIGIPQTAMPWYPYAGVNATPNNCARHMSQIITPASSPSTQCLKLSVPPTGAVTPSIGHWRIMGLDCTRDQSGDAVTSLINLDFQPAASGQDCALIGTGVTATPANPTQCAADQYDHVILDRYILHGDPQRQTVRAISLGGGTFLANLNYYIYDIQDTFAGGQGDAQSFAGGFGHGYTGVGDWLWHNGFSASSSEGQLFCGAFSEPISPVTNKDGTPTSGIQELLWMYKPIVWDTQRGQTLNETLVNEGTSYPPQGDQEIVWQPTSFTVQQGLGFNLNNTWLNDSAGGWNRFNVTGTPPNNTGTATIDGIPFTTITSASGILSKANVTVGSAPWQMQNIIQWTYTACSGNNVPAGIGCTAATTAGPHTIVFGGVVLDDGRADLTKLGNNRTLTTTITATVTTGAPTNLIALTPSAPDLQIQPSYSDAFGNTRNFAYVFSAATNFSSVSMTWKVDGVTNGSTTVGRICSVTAVPCVAPASNDSRVVYVSGTGLGAHTISVTSAAGTTTSQIITVSKTSPVWAYDLKAMTVKNMWETKCASRWVLKNSLLENTHGSQGNGGGQNTAMLTQPANNANQTTDGSGASVGYGPENVSDVLIDHIHTLHSGGGIVAAGLNVAKGIHRVTYSNILMEDHNCPRYSHGFVHSQFCVFSQITGTAGTTVLGWTSTTTPLMNDVNFSHITSVGGTATIPGINSWVSVANNNLQFQLGPFSAKDSIFAAPGIKPFTNNDGENGDCNHNNIAETEFTAFLGTGYSPATPCFSTYSLANTLLLDNTSLSTVFATPTIWNNVASTDPTVFRNYNNGSDGDYRLAAGSPYAAGGARAASDGTDLGADVAGIMANDATIRWGGPTPLTITTTSLTNATHGSPYSATLAATGGTGQLTWSLPGGIRPPGSIDVLDYALMPSPTRNTTHMGGATYKAFRLDGGLFWWLKGSTGNPWDGEVYDGSNIYHWFTEDGDSVDNPACVAAGFSSCFTDPFASKTFVTPAKVMPRYFVLGGPDAVVTNPSPNNFIRTTNCGADNQPPINLGNIMGVLHDGGAIAWGGSVGTVETLINNYYWGISNLTTIPPTSGTRERYWLAQGFGQIQWDTSHWDSTTSAFIVDQTSTNLTPTAGGAPTPNFGCKVPTLPILNRLPAGTLLSSSPQMNLTDAGVLSGTPLTIGNSVFTVQVEDSVGHIAQRSLSLTVQ